MVDVVVLGGNRGGEQIYDWLLGREDADVLAPITDSSQHETTARLEPELVVSAGFRHIAPEQVLDIPEYGAINCHLAYISYNFKMKTNGWRTVEGTPAGVSINYMTPDVDAGPIIARREVEKRPDDDRKSLYNRLESSMGELFTDEWETIADGDVETEEQPVRKTPTTRNNSFRNHVKSNPTRQCVSVTLSTVSVPSRFRRTTTRTSNRTVSGTTSKSRLPTSRRRTQIRHTGICRNTMSSRTCGTPAGASAS